MESDVHPRHSSPDPASSQLGAASRDWPNVEPQLTFDWGRPNLFNFETFFDASDQGMVHHLKTILHRPDRMVFVCGRAGFGKSHLLQATCHLAGVRRRSAMYLPLSDVIAEVRGGVHESPMAVIDGLEQLDLVCVDDVDQVIGQADWQEALFHLYNECLASGTAMVFSAALPPTKLSIELADLKSRLGSCVVYRVEGLSDDQKMECMQHRASMLGLELNNAIVDYLMQRGSREVTDLVNMIDILDRASMAAKRKLSIPLIKTIFGWET